MALLSLSREVTLTKFAKALTIDAAVRGVLEVDSLDVTCLSHIAPFACLALAILPPESGRHTSSHHSSRSSQAFSVENLIHSTRTLLGTYNPKTCKSS